MTDMSPNRPYLIRAIYQWICDNGLTPYLLVDAHFPGVLVPQDYVQDGQITLNVAPRSISQLSMENAAVSFSARFAGIPQQVFVPPMAVLAVYARENAEGMVFDPVAHPDPQPPSGEKPKKDSTRSHLKVIK